MTTRGRDAGEGQQRDAEKTEPVPPAIPQPTGRDTAAETSTAPEDVEEIGGPKGPEPTRFGDWEKGGRCSDF